MHCAVAAGSPAAPRNQRGGAVNPAADATCFREGPCNRALLAGARSHGRGTCLVATAATAGECEAKAEHGESAGSGDGLNNSQGAEFEAAIDLADLGSHAGREVH